MALRASALTALRTIAGEPAALPTLALRASALTALRTIAGEPAALPTLTLRASALTALRTIAFALALRSSAFAGIPIPLSLRTVASLRMRGLMLAGLLAARLLLLLTGVLRLAVLSLSRTNSPLGPGRRRRRRLRLPWATIFSPPLALGGWCLLLRSALLRRRLLGSHLGSRIGFDVAEELLDGFNHAVLHYAHMVVHRHILPLENRNDFFAAHVERFGIFVNAKLILVVGCILFTQYSPPPNVERNRRISIARIHDPSRRT